MTDRFEAWWASNPARVVLNPAAKEVARGIWRAAQQDLATELVEIGKETRAGVNQPPVCTNSDSWNCKYCRQAATCEALNAAGDRANGRVPLVGPVDKGAPC